METCPKEAAVVIRTLNRLENMQEGQDLVTDSYKSKEGGHAEDHIKGVPSENGDIISLGR